MLAYSVINTAVLLSGKSMSDLPNCPKCDSIYAYEDGNMYICPECAQKLYPDIYNEK